MDCEFAAQDGRLLVCRCNMGSVPDSSNVLVALTDLTRERAYEAILEERASTLTDFLQVASHELQLPVTVIKGYTQTLLTHMHNLPRDALEEILKTLEIYSSRMAALVDELLDSNRLDGERIVFEERRELDLEALCHEAVGALNSIGRSNPVSIKIEPELRQVYGNHQSLARVLFMLLDNAAKYGRDGSPIEMELARWQHGAMFSILDRGPGIPREYARRIFERFFRIEDAFHHGSGLGLGLFIARQIVESHRGELWCESRQEGGAAFHFTIP